MAENMLDRSDLFLFREGISSRLQYHNITDLDLCAWTVLCERELRASFRPPY